MYTPNVSSVSCNSAVIPIEQKVEKQNISSCCPISRSTWRKIINGTVATTASTSLAFIIYGLINQDFMMANVAAAGLAVSGFLLCSAHYIAVECTEDDFQERIRKAANISI